MTPENTPEDGALNDELRFMRKVLAVAETFHELSPDKQQEKRLAELEQECPNPFVRSVLTGLRNYQRMGQLDNFRACLRSDVQREDKKMNNDTETPMPPVDRETAAKLNPYISDDPTIVDTRNLVADALRGLSHMIDVCQSATGHPLDVDTCIELLQDKLRTLAGALEYEAPQDGEAKPEVE